MLLHRVVRDAGEGDTVERRPHHQVAVTADQRPGYVNFQALAALLKIPTMHCPAYEPHPRAIMCTEIGRFLRRSMAAKIIRRCHHRGLRILSDTKCNHILLDAVTGANAGIEAIAHDVGQRAIDDDLERYGGIAAEDARAHPLRAGLLSPGA